MFLGGLGKATKEGMRNVGFGSELGMKLACNKPRVVGEFNNFYEVTFWVNSADFQAKFLQVGTMHVIKFIPMSMAFLDS